MPRNKKSVKSMHQQAYDRLHGMLCIGHSKHQAKAADGIKDKIFSFNTYKAYMRSSEHFIAWVKTHHPDCHTIKNAERFVPAYLQARMDQGLSAWTIHADKSALCKLYQIDKDDKNYFRPPRRERSDIKRSRGDAVRDRNFSETKHKDLVDFCRGTGLRRRELEELRGRDLISRSEVCQRIQDLSDIPAESRSARDRAQLKAANQALMFSVDYFVDIRNGKGGRPRLAPIIGDQSAIIVAKIAETGSNDKVWPHVNSNADIHGYRGDYANQIYSMYARDIKDIPFDRVNRGSGYMYQSDVYACRGDQNGRQLDRAAMQMCSIALGHNRVDIVANNYLVD